jgi:hypothetical protein
MKAKNMTLMSLSILSIVFLMTLIMATIILNPITHSTSIEQGASETFTFTINNTHDEYSVVELSITPSDLISGTNTLTSSNVEVMDLIPLEIIPGAESIITVTLNIPSDQEIGTYTGEIVVDGNYNDTSDVYNRTLALTVEVTEAIEPTPEVDESLFCDEGSIDYSDLILKVDIKNNGEGEDEEWLPLDTIEIEVELQNDKDDIDLDNVIIELGLFEVGSTNNIMDEMMWISADEELVDLGDIDAGDDDKFTFEFKVDPQEVDDANYILVVKAYPDDDEDLTCIDFSSDLGESKFGDSEFYAEIQINQENDKDKMVIIDETSISSPIPASCGQNVIFSADIYNIGDEDFEDKTKVTLKNTELGLDLAEVVLGDMDAGDNSQISFAFSVPKSAEEKQYPLAMKVWYDYDEDDDTYDRISDETFNAYLKVEGNCATVVPVSVSATLESGGLAAQDLVVKAIVTNNGNSEQDYIINAAGYTTWAATSSLSESVFTLAAGQSKEVLFTFAVNEDADGTYYFNIEILSENQLVLNQAVSVLIENPSGNGFFSGLTGSAIGGSSYLWGIGLLNLVLIVIIIILAVRVSRR